MPLSEISTFEISVFIRIGFFLGLGKFLDNIKGKKSPFFQTYFGHPSASYLHVIIQLLPPCTCEEKNHLEREVLLLVQQLLKPLDQEGPMFISIVLKKLSTR